MTSLKTTCKSRMRRYGCIIAYGAVLGFTVAALKGGRT